MTQNGRRGLGASLGTLLLVIGATCARAGDVSLSARNALATATTAALAWAEDAELVYLENDEALDAGGASARWGFLFRAQGGRVLRAYSVEGARLRHAAAPPLRYDAPPVRDGWIDSAQALAPALERAADELKMQPPLPTSALLSRGVFDRSNPDHTTWTFVFTLPDAPSLFVVIDAEDAKVLKTWRG